VLAEETAPVSFDRLRDLLYRQRMKYGIYSAKPTREEDGRLTYVMRKPQNPDNVAAEHADIQLTVLSEIARPGSRRVSLEGIGLLDVHSYAGAQPLREAAAGQTRLLEKWRLSVDELHHLLATLLHEMRLKRALSHPN